MAYSFPPKDDRSSSYLSPTPPSRSYLSDRAIPSGYPPTTVDYRDAEFYGYPTDLRDPVEREREKQRIREEIMTEQMARRRILEEEVRRELMLEREVTMRRWESSTMLFDSETSRIPQSFGHYEERRFPYVPVVPMSSHPVDEVGILGSSAYQHHLMPTPSSSLDLRDIRLLPEPREDTILLAMREPNITGANRKRKASTLEEDHRHRARSFEKKPKGWRCKLCKITCTNEMNLKQHYQGKKHKLMKEGGLLPEEMKELPLNNSDKPGPSHPIVNTTKECATLPENLRNDTTITDKKQINQPNGLLKIREPGSSTTPNGLSKKREPRFSTTPGGSSRRRESGSSTTPGSVKKFNFWCKICQVGATSEVVLTSHERGKKHLAKLEELKAEPGSSSAMPQVL